MKPLTKKQPLKFTVQIDGIDKSYEYPNEDGAVMFAMRYSRDHAARAYVYDPDYNEVTKFYPRKYDVKQHQRERAALFLSPNVSLQRQVAAARPQVQKQPAKKPLRRKR